MIKEKTVSLSTSANSSIGNLAEVRRHEIADCSLGVGSRQQRQEEGCVNMSEQFLREIISKTVKSLYVCLCPN